MLELYYPKQTESCYYYFNGNSTEKKEGDVREAVKNMPHDDHYKGQKFEYRGPGGSRVVISGPDRNKLDHYVSDSNGHKIQRTQEIIIGRNEKGHVIRQKTFCDGQKEILYNLDEKTSQLSGYRYKSLYDDETRLIFKINLRRQKFVNGLIKRIQKLAMKFGLDGGKERPVLSKVVELMFNVAKKIK